MEVEYYARLVGWIFTAGSVSTTLSALVTSSIILSSSVHTLKHLLLAKCDINITYIFLAITCAALSCPMCVCLQVEVKVAQSKEALAMQTGKGRTNNGRNGFGNNLFFALHLLLGMLHLSYAVLWHVCTST